AAERGRGPVQREVAETDAVQELEPADQLAERRTADAGRVAGQRPAPDLGERAHHGLLHNLRVAPVEEPHRPGNRLETRALAGGARLGGFLLLGTTEEARPLAVLAPSLRGVEGEPARVQLGDGGGTARAAALRREELLPRRTQHLHRALAPAQRLLEG